ncbi:hypothetical protein AD31_3164 [Escherichia coli 2-427-07_S4_C3]|nr:hypothetical protein AD31_3164 [Escherichia coli 2-427-07_S4_C3]
MCTIVQKGDARLSPWFEGDQVLFLSVVSGLNHPRFTSQD